MQRRRRKLLFAVVGVAVAIGAACTFPEPRFEQDDAGGTEAGGESSTGEGGTIDAPILIDGQDPDALIVQDAGQRIDAAGCDACDCDEDGFKDTTKVGCEGGAPDCDDTDPRAKPGQGFLQEKPEPPLNGNWDCKPPIERLYPPNLNCSKFTSQTDCSFAAGFTNDPGCGEKGTFVQCKWACDVPPLVGCKCGAGVPDLNTIQACK